MDAETVHQQNASVNTATKGTGCVFATSSAMAKSGGAADGGMRMISITPAVSDGIRNWLGHSDVGVAWTHFTGFELK
jgi:hypothetical protein